MDLRILTRLKIQHAGEIRHWIRKLINYVNVISTFRNLTCSKKEMNCERVAAVCLCQWGWCGASACIRNPILGRFLHVSYDFW